ncbi:hypothetical protein BST11_12175 [Mycobacterium alsense]|uniref:Acyl-CoA synthase n=1 Tax=Mycobacterium alsense TaxID=324058 RepID=A0AA42BZJ2_9MYCO|nr:hypothetical protein [Mycobacterium alsense]MCV7380845.1 hypothetical protein [Mycobacterium alsense]OQZ90506.1 hypothetical protein BST11_12175 [Mycobacterium alsense]
MTSGEGSHDGTVERREGDDYDLLTFGEVRARLAELLAVEKDELARLVRQAGPDDARVRRLKERIALLESSDTRYRDLARTNEPFARRFGPNGLAPPDADAPRWT